MLATIARPLNLHAASEPAAVGVVRRQVRRWLIEIIDDADTVDDLVLAVSEAVENVVDHAFVDVDEPGSITVCADHDGRQITIRIVDDGRWQTAQDHDAHDHRGRGLSLISKLADSSTVVTGLTGTTVTLVHGLPG